MADYRHIIVGVHGYWGAGKTWFADTAPGPRLILDHEGGSMDTLSDKVHWSPYDDPPAAKDLTKDTSVVVHVTDWDMVSTAVEVLQGGQHPFNSVIVDSLTEMQATCKAVISDGPDSTFEHKHWRRLKDHMEADVRKLRDMTWPNAKRPINVVLVMGSDMEKVQATPLIEGGLRKTLPGFVDMLMFLKEATSDKGEEIRVGEISSSDTVSAKCRLHNVKKANGRQIINPDMRKILKEVNA